MKVLLFTTALLSGLVAGLLYAYSCSVNIGLKTLTNTEYIKAMQSINIAIQNPLFFVSFMGLLIVFPITTFQLFRQQPNSIYLFVGAMVIYFVGVFGITLFGNVPLNEQLAKFPILKSNDDEISIMRKTFENPWNNFHSIRTVASIVSFALTILFILKQKFN
ncbi:MAG: anthrone oxygenase family protein [Ferruginibacter sp.]